MRLVLDHAEALGLRVTYRDLGSRAGELHSSGLIVINPRKSPMTQMVAVAHECGHWVRGHDWSAMHDTSRDEREADAYAAHLLINPWEYARAERLVGSGPNALGRELGVPGRIVAIWQARLDGSGLVRRMAG